MGDEAWDTFQVSCNEFRSTICKVCTGKNQFGTLMTCRGTHQGMPWAAHGLPWHTPRHAVAYTKACHGKPWHPMGLPWHTPRHALAPHGQSMAHTKAFFEEILGLWTRYFAHMLRKIIPSSLPSFTFFGKKKKKIIFLIGKIGKFIKNRKWVASGS